MCVSPEYLSVSFWHSKNLNTNNNEKHNSDESNRNPADLNVYSWYCRINTMTQKYVFNPSETYKGVNADHQLMCATFSSFRISRMENKNMATSCIHISKAVSPNHLTRSLRDRNISKSSSSIAPTYTYVVSHVLHLLHKPQMQISAGL